MIFVIILTKNQKRKARKMAFLTRKDKKILFEKRKKELKSFLRENAPPNKSRTKRPKVSLYKLGTPLSMLHSNSNKRHIMDCLTQYCLDHRKDTFTLCEAEKCTEHLELKSPLRGFLLKLENSGHIEYVYEKN